MTTSIGAFILICGCTLYAPKGFTADYSTSYIHALRTERAQLISEIDEWVSSDYSKSEVVELRVKRKRDRLQSIDRILASHEEIEQHDLQERIWNILDEYRERVPDSDSLLKKDTRSKDQMFADGDKPPAMASFIDASFRGNSFNEIPAGSNLSSQVNSAFKFKVLPELLDISLPQYFRILNDPESYGLRLHNQIIFDELEKNFESKPQALSKEDDQEVVDIMNKALERGRLPRGINRLMVKAWLKLPLSSRQPDLTKKALYLMDRREKIAIGVPEVNQVPVHLPLEIPTEGEDLYRRALRRSVQRMLKFPL
jgi:hypothetical protein